MHLAGKLAFAAALGLAGISPVVAATAPAAWQQASQIDNRAWADVQANGILAIKPHVAEIEQALADGKQTGPRTLDGDTIYVLTDGMADSLAAMAAVTADASHAGRKAVAIANPYPRLALVLGSYYDEIGQPADALRVLDEGLAIIDAATTVLQLSESRPGLLIERGEALIALHRFDDALADFDEGLKADDLDPKLKAHLMRGRGFALTELGRLDDAEKAYRDSLAIDPGNPTAEHELAYLAQLRAGGKAMPSSLNSVQPQTAPEDKATPSGQ